MNKQLGRLEKIKNIRDIWDTEDRDFTPWLAEEGNISLLGEAIGLSLEVEAQEKSVGPFRADILCKDTADDSWVLIENQLERTDHKHLGQLMTYASGLKAVTIVWISTNFTEEHRSSLDWLNQITDDSFNFFGLEIELRKDLSTLFSMLEHWRINFNGSYIISDEKYSEDELKLRRLGLREGQSVGTSRPLQGQSPYLLNAGLEYNNQDKGFQGGLFYNVQGKTLQVVGNGFYSDVYTIPFNSLNFNFIKQLRKNRTLTFKVTNLLDDNRESQFIGYKQEREYFSFRQIGRTFSINYSFRF